ncbi:MAG: hypothetical protein KDM64_18810, partial [Verrucomicrobiae bacterium]|nr:hypothetical protein [Verrucomicrobiae bacterium]
RGPVRKAKRKDITIKNGDTVYLMIPYKSGITYFYGGAQNNVYMWDYVEGDDKQKWKIWKEKGVDGDDIRSGDKVKFENVNYPNYYLFEPGGNYLGIQATSKDVAASWVIEIK